MTITTAYLNIIKFVTIAFVLAFTAYTANSNEVIMDIEPFPTCTECMPENSDADTRTLTLENRLDPSLRSSDQPEISLGGDGLISIAVLNPDLSDFDSIRFAIVEITDLEIAAEYISYSLKDINHDEQTDLVFYFSTRDLTPPQPAAKEISHDACLFVDILNTDKSISNYNICANAIFLAQEKI
ncbi:MAG: hypothetical protein EHJ94_09330 [Deltaproteobacteria bacterium]|nr:MAG: hypothetical protein EHJ94_09330 [Deltaproteobacteria bacterium]